MRQGASRTSRTGEGAIIGVGRKGGGVEIRGRGPEDVRWCARGYARGWSPAIAAVLVGGMLLYAGCADRNQAGSDPLSGGGTSAGEGNSLAPTAQALGQAETQRVGALVRLHGRGTVQLTRCDEGSERMDQGDLDLRWHARMGLAAGVSKLGDRWAWIGSDLSDWWIFDLKGTPSTLQVGSLRDGNGALAPAFTWLAGMQPLVPADGAQPRWLSPSEHAEGGKDGAKLLRVAVAVPEGALPQGARLEADFDPRALEPAGVLLTLADGAQWRSTFNGWIMVETPGQPPGAWPRIPRRTQVVTGPKERWTSLQVGLDTARDDAAAVERAALYDLSELQIRFAPQEVVWER